MLMVAPNDSTGQSPFSALRAVLTKFLTPFQYEKITLELHSDRKDDHQQVNLPHFKSANILRATYDAAGIPFYDKYKPESIDSTKGAPELKSKTSHAFTLPELLADDTLKELLILQQAGRAVWFMPNEGTGIAGPPPNENCRNQKNVKLLKACFLDTDSCPIEKVNLYLNSVGIAESICVSTSPNKYHLYFLIEDTEVNPYSIEMWKCVQHALHSFSNPTLTPSQLGTDGSMADYSKVLRLPGFFHQKRAKHLVSVVAMPGVIKFTLADLYERLNGKAFLSRVSGPTSDKTGHVYQIPSEPLKGGSRHYAIMEFAGHAKHSAKTKDELLRSVLGFIVQNAFEDYVSFLPGGERYLSDTVKQVDFAWEKKVEAEKSYLTEIMVKADKEESEEADIKEMLHLNKEIFLSLPGLAGDMIREGCEKAPYPIPPMFFATISALIGTIKSHYVSFNDWRPCNYFICTAPSGSGKSFPHTMISDALKRLGHLKLMRGDIRSGQGTVSFLQKNGGYGFLLIDEAAKLLKVMQSDRAQSYEQEILMVLLRFYGLHNTPYIESEVRKDPKDRIELPFVRLNSVMFGTEELLNSVFTQSSIQIGFLPRQLVFNWNKPTEFVASRKRPTFSNQIIDRLRELILKANLANEDKLIEIAEKEEELATLANTSTRYKELRREIEKLASNGEASQTALTISPDAEARLDKFGVQMADKANREKKQESGIADIYTRSHEQVCRLLPVFTDGEEISSELVNSIIKIVELQKEAFTSVMIKQLRMGPRQEAAEKVYSQIVKLCMQSNEGWIRKGIANRNIFASRQYPTTLLLDDLVRSGRLIVEREGKLLKLFVADQ